MDQTAEEVSSGSTDPNRDGNGPKCCTICRTTKTPLWRGGPSGPKSLCNACGIRYRKERREMVAIGAGVGVEKIKKEKKKTKKKQQTLASGGGTGNRSVIGLLGFGAEVLPEERSTLWLKRRRRLAEEEEAAVLLMALSSGFF